MKTLRLSLLILTLSAMAQDQFSISSGQSVKVGSIATRDITISSGTPLPAAAQFTVSWTNMSNVSVSIGSVSTGASKNLSCAPASPTSISCLVVGLNQTTIPNGQLAKVTFTAVKTPSLSGTLSTVAGTIIPLVVDPNAIPIPTTGGSVTIPFVRAEDLNSDGVVNQFDLDLFWQQMMPGGTCTTGDINGDGKCDVLDAQMIAMAALGL
jgi:dockerin type I repeat protein